MGNSIVDRAIDSVVSGEMSYCKFLSANDTGATGGHQCGILVSVSAREMLFNNISFDESIVKREVKIKWQTGDVTDSVFTYYESKRELRITKFGRGFELLNSSKTGSLFVLTKLSADDYFAFIIDTEEEIEIFLSTFGIGPTETNCVFGAGGLQKVFAEQEAINSYISSLEVMFPETEVMSFAAREISNGVYGHIEHIKTNPDRKVIEWTDMEYTLFRTLEEYRYGEMIKKGFSSVEEFVGVANSVLNRRKSRAGKSLEHHLQAIFDDNGVVYEAQAITEGKKRPDFLFPSSYAYRDMKYPIEKILTLAAKTTCKDRWRQILNEANRLKDRKKYLCTLQQGVSPSQLEEMKAEGVVLVVPKPYISYYPKEYKDDIWSVKKFVDYVKEIQSRN